MNSTLKPETATVVLIDHQVGTLQLVKNIASDVALRNAVNLAMAAETLDMPLVMTASQEDQIQGPLSPALRRAAPGAYDARIKRQGIVSAWDEPAFKAAVEASERGQLIMAGVTTDVCLVFPAISAVREGYEVFAVLDASGSPTELSEEMARRRMEQAGVVLTATNTVIAELARDWSTPAGSKLVVPLVAAAPMLPAL